MWFLGAGASASAGLPTATDMIWEFKQKLFVSQRRGSSNAVANLAQQNVRARLQAHIDSLEHLPKSDTPEEYAALFEEVYPAESDRRAFLDAKLAGAKPSYGHLALATLMHGQRSRLVWTTNFDALVADACAKVFDSTGALTTADLDGTDLAKQVIGDERWPVEIKLHGDFRSRRLKNTDGELRQQDATLRRLLIDSCHRNGLIVIGYSGRDESVMDALEEAIKHPTPFPAGLFWLHRGEGEPSPRVTNLLNLALREGVESALVPIQNFDETMCDLIRLTDGLDTTVLQNFAKERRRRTMALIRQGRRGWPVVRLNALPIIRSPSTCRLVVCEIGGTADVRRAVAKVGVDVLAVRSRLGVLAFGADSDVRCAFEAYDITGFDLYTLEPKRRRYESSERGLLHDALIRGIVRHRGMRLTQDSRWHLIPRDLQDSRWTPLRALVKRLSGTIKDHANLRWYEGIVVRLDSVNDHLWLLFEPKIIFEGLTDQNKIAAADFAREHGIKRYNRELNQLLGFWAKFLAKDEEEMRAFNLGDGIDAIFALSPVTGFSRRVVS